MSESIISLSDFKADASRLLNEIQQQPRTLVLTQNGRARAVVQDYGQYRLQRDGMLMLKLMIQGEADVQQERLQPQAKVFDDLRRQLGSIDPENG